MHSATPIASRTRSRKIRRSDDDRSEVVIGVSSDDDDDDVVVVDEVPAKLQQQRSYEASGFGTKRFDSDAMQSHGVAVSEEEEEDGDGDEVIFVGEGSKEGEDSEDCGDDVGVEKSKGENREEIELGMKRKRKFGLDILVDHTAAKEVKSVAQRTRSRYRKTMKQKLGTFSQPICLEDDDDGGGSGGGHDNDHDGDEEQEKAQEEEQEEKDEDEDEDEEEEEFLSDYDDDFDFDDADDDDTEEGSDSDDEDYRIGGHRKREGYACAKKLPKKSVKLMGKNHKKKSGFDVAKILKDSVYGKCEVPLEDIDDDDDVDGDGEGETSSNVALPSNFSFSKEKSTPPKKSGEEDDLDEIWDEMEHGLEATRHSTGSDSLHSSLEEGRVYNEVKSRGPYRKGSAFARKKLVDVNDQTAFGEFRDILLQDSIHDDKKGEGSVDASARGRNSCVDMPLKFNFRSQEEPPAEKSESEKETDALFAEMEYSLYIIQQEKATLEAQQVAKNKECDDKYPIDDPETPALYRCRGGVHELVRDWEFGDYCRYCGHVAMDIRSWTPPFLENPFGRYDRRDPYAEDRVNHSVFDELRDQNSGYDDYNHRNRKGTVWDIIPGVRKTMYPHQREAFEFLWKNLAGGIILDELKGENGSPNGSGCIISHAPGTGKTRLTIVFLQTYMELNPTCTPMIIAPKGMLLTWEEEFKTWKVDIPFHNLNNFEYSGNEDEAAMNVIRKYDHNTSAKAAKLYCRLAKLYSWKLGKSILGVSYNLFVELTRKGSPDKDLRKFLLEQPGLVVLDEGHTPRNSKTRIWKSVTEIQTELRIILSGTPFQNNFDELYNTLCLARPEFAKRNPRKENRGRWGYLTNSFGKVTDDSRRFEILKKIRNMIQPFVHVHKGTILQDNLPGLRQTIVILKPTQLQKQLLDDIQREREKLDKGKKRFKNILKIEYEESVTAVHPSLFQLYEESKNKFQRLRLNPEESAKTKFLMELIMISEIFNEKVLVFSQFIKPLKLLTSQLKHIFGWSEGREVLQMHGKLEAKLRQASIKAFNDPKSQVRVMLASTKACYEGISLVGASRVVLLDVVWNPSVERQAISRAYRLGQEKFVHTYHLITVGTRDEEKCSRQAEKDELSELVFFNSDAAQHREVHSSAELEDRVLEHMVQQQNLRHMFEKVAIKKQNLL